MGLFIKYIMWPKLSRSLEMECARLTHVLSGLEAQLKVTEKSLNWNFLNHEEEPVELTSRRILAANTAVIGDHLSHLNIHYVKVVRGEHGDVTLKREETSFCGEQNVCDQFCNNVNKLLSVNEIGRPRRIVIFINPMSGWHKAETDYKNIVKPLMDTCNIQVDCIVTKDAEEPRAVLSTYDLSNINVIVNMGGDGALKQVITGLLERTAKDAKIDVDDSKCVMVKPSIPIGNLPSGTVNGVSMFSNGTHLDIETATINIILGYTQPSPVLVVRNSGKVIGYSVIWSTIGYFTLVTQLTEKLRFLGKSRLKLFTAFKWLFFRQNDVMIEYLPVPEQERDFRQCNEGKDTINNGSRITDGPDPGWKTYRGKVNDITVNPYPFLGILEYYFIRKHQPTYQKPNVSPGKWLLYIERATSFWQTYKYWWTFDTKESRQKVPREVAEQVEITECRMRATGNWTSGQQMCHDGDLLDLEHGINIHWKGVKDAYDLVCIDDRVVLDGLSSAD